MTAGKWLLGSALWLFASMATAGCWPAWEQFKTDLISADGRVIDPAQGRISTSEGQTYGLFFALVANDRESFQHLLNWTENNLAGGNLSKQLPAWKWGQDEHGKWRILDSNNASDADLWLAYSLLEAGRLWAVAEYRELAIEVLWRVAAQTLRPLPGVGVMLLPGDRGFVTAQGTRLNTSYLPPQVLERFTELAPLWDELARNSRKLLLDSAPKGLAPDWLAVTDNGTLRHDPVNGAKGSYDAIRVYLWLGMLDPSAPERNALLERYRPMVELTRKQGVPPETVNVESGAGSGQGPVGFSAAMLPLLAALKEQSVLQQQRQRLVQTPASGYYNRVLSLFGQGWDEHRYRFDGKGRLVPGWETAQCEN